MSSFVNGRNGGSREEETDDEFSTLTVEWMHRQMKRYDTMVGGFTRTGNEETVKRAWCLAFVRAMLNDKATERMLATAMFEFTERMVGECEQALGREKVMNAKAPLLLLLYHLPVNGWKAKTYEALRDYCCRDRAEGRRTIGFRNFLGSTLRTVANYIVQPLADIIEPWL